MGFAEDIAAAAPSAAVDFFIDPVSAFFAVAMLALILLDVAVDMFDDWPSQSKDDSEGGDNGGGGGNFRTLLRRAVAGVVPIAIDASTHEVAGRDLSCCFFDVLSVVAV